MCFQTKKAQTKAKHPTKVNNHSPGLQQKQVARSVFNLPNTVCKDLPRVYTQKVPTDLRGVYTKMFRTAIPKSHLKSKQQGVKREETVFGPIDLVLFPSQTWINF